MGRKGCVKCEFKSLISDLISSVSSCIKIIALLKNR